MDRRIYKYETPRNLSWQPGKDNGPVLPPGLQLWFSDVVDTWRAYVLPELRAGYAEGALICITEG